MGKVKVKFVSYDMDKTKKRKRKDFLVDGKSERDVRTQLEKIHKGEKVVTIHELTWDEEQIQENIRKEKERKNLIFTGEVKFFDDTKGFGFIAPDEDMDDLFFHGTAVSGDEVTDEDRVEFELSESPKGPCAIHVKKI